MGRLRRKELHLLGQFRMVQGWNDEGLPLLPNIQDDKKLPLVLSSLIDEVLLLIIRTVNREKGPPFTYPPNSLRLHTLQVLFAKKLS